MKATPTQNDTDIKRVRQQALDFLARREYARLELRRKLLGKGFEAEIIDQVLEQLQTRHLLNEERFLESFIRARITKGHGPLRIQQELQQRGIQKETIVTALDVHNECWIERAHQVRQKRFGSSLPSDTREKMKQLRFLQYRGFTPTQIEAVLIKHFEE